MRTELCETLGMEVPIIQAPVGRAAGTALAAAVSNAGGLGAMALGSFGAEGTRDRLRAAKQATNHGFVANLLLSYDCTAEFEAILADPPKAVAFFWGDVAPYAGRVHDAGSLVIAEVGSVEEAQRAVDQGADIIVAQGWEAGGHVRGTMSTMTLVPAVVDAVGDVPVVAAGGIADGRGLAAALCLGAQAAWIGTRFLSADEADIHPDYQARVLAGAASDTLYTTLFNEGWADAPARALRNRAIEDWEAAGRPATGKRPGEGEVIGHEPEGYDIHRYEPFTARAATEGAIDYAPLWAGQGVGLVRKTQPAAEIVAEIAEEARQVLAGVRV